MKILSQDRVEVSVEVERPSSEELHQYDRSQRYQVLRENNLKRYQELVAWLESEGLADEVEQVAEPTVFNQVFMTSTSRVAQALERAPGVVRVFVGNPQLESDLPSPSERVTL